MRQRGAIARWTTVDPSAENSYELTPFRYGLNNPIRVVDPTGEYEEDGHFWTTYLMLTMMGKQNAYQVAWSAESPDLIMNTGGDIVREANTWLMPSWQKRVHALNGELAIDATDKGLEMILAAKSNYELGIGIHYLGDSFAHRQVGNEAYMYSSPLGHGLANIWATFVERIASSDAATKQLPDNIANRPELYKQYVRTLSMALGNYSNPLDMFTFDYIANSGGGTKQNDAVIEAEIRIRQGVSSFSVSGDYGAAIKGYILVANNHFGRNVQAKTSRRTVTHLKKDSNGNWVDDYTEEVTYVTFQ